MHRCTLYPVKARVPSPTFQSRVHAEHSVTIAWHLGTLGFLGFLGFLDFPALIFAALDGRPGMSTGPVTPAGDAAEFAPPCGPPPFLSPDEVHQLCQDGHLALRLPVHLADQYAALFSHASAFFALPADEKHSAFPAAASDTEQGYSRVPGEKEFISVRYLDGDRLGEPAIAWAGDLARAWHDTAHLLHRILAAVGVRLAMSPEAWDSVVADGMNLPTTERESTPTLMRLFRYEPRGGVADAHRDLGLLTLCVCRGRGLQVWERNDGQPGETWRAAAPVTLLVGDTLRALSGNRVPAAMHRVEASEDGRASIVFALRASTRRSLNLAHFGGEGIIDTDALWNRILIGRVNINQQKDVRERMRARVGKG